MGEAFAVMLILAVLTGVVVGAIMGWVAVFQIRALQQRARDHQSRLEALEGRAPAPRAAQRPAEPAAVPARPAEAPPEPVEHAASTIVASRTADETPRAAQATPAPPPLPEARPVTAPEPARKPMSMPDLEVLLGTTWLARIGAVVVVIGLAFFLKYAYDNSWIGAQGRLAIGTITGFVAMGIGQYCRRKQWPVLFQALTGAGLATLYVCVYFAFQVYELAGQSLSMGLAVGVTVLAVALAVTFNAMSIGILGLIGGFLSPILISSGENHPYALFTYIAILDLVAIGAAYFRRWRAIDLLSFVGTTLIFGLWYEEFYDPAEGQMMPGLVYATLFYLMFLILPMVHSLLHPAMVLEKDFKARREDMTLLVGNAVTSYFWYHRMLFADYRHELGWIVLGQAAVVFVLFLVWSGRAGSRNAIGQSLLAIALALVTLSVPIHLKMYAVPIAWSIKGAVLAFLGVRFRQALCKATGFVALVLAAIALLTKLPLHGGELMHSGEFTPVWNVAFLSWIAVITAAAAAAFILSRTTGDRDDLNTLLSVAFVLMAFGLGCIALSMEVWDSWSLWDGDNVDAHRASSLMVLWSLIPACTAAVVGASRRGAWSVLPVTCYLGGVLVFLGGLGLYDDIESTLLTVNVSFGSRLALVAGLWAGAYLLRNVKEAPFGRICEMAGHVVLTILLAFEFVRWSQCTDVVSDLMGVGLISAVWAVLAFTLIWTGLVTRCGSRRVLGFVLFGITLCKITFWDMASLGRVHLIISCIVSGLLLLAAAYFYQKYSHALLGKGDGPDGDHEEAEAVS